MRGQVATAARRPSKRRRVLWCPRSSFQVHATTRCSTNIVRNFLIQHSASARGYQHDLTPVLTVCPTGILGVSAARQQSTGIGHYLSQGGPPRSVLIPSDVHCALYGGQVPGIVQSLGPSGRPRVLNPRPESATVVGCRPTSYGRCPTRPRAPGWPPHQGPFARSAPAADPALALIPSYVERILESYHAGLTLGFTTVCWAKGPYLHLSTRCHIPAQVHRGPAVSLCITPPVMRLQQQGCGQQAELQIALSIVPTIGGSKVPNP